MLDTCVHTYVCMDYACMCVYVNMCLKGECIGIKAMQSPITSQSVKSLLNVVVLEFFEMIINNSGQIVWSETWTS